MDHAAAASAAAGHRENFAPQVIQRLAKEIRQLHLSPPDGITFVPNGEETLMKVYADVEGPTGTPYEGGVFRVRLCISSEYPRTPPLAHCETRIWHPNISAQGDICVNTLKKDWTATTTLTHVLQVIRCLLIVPFPESSLNDEAGKQFMESYEDYAKRARLLTSVHAMRKSGGGGGHGSTSGQAGAQKAAAAAEGKEAGSGDEEEDDEKGAAAGGGGGEPGAGVLGSPNVAGMIKRKAGANTAQRDAAADKQRNKKRGLKRL